MKRRHVVLSLILILAGSACALAASESGPGPGSPGFGLRETVLQTLIRLDLSDAQKRQAALILQKRRAEASAVFENLERELAALSDVMRDSPGDEAAVRVAGNKVAAAGVEMAVTRGRIVAELRGILTPEQARLLAEGRGAIRDKVREKVAAARTLIGEWVETHAGDGAGPR